LWRGGIIEVLQNHNEVSGVDVSETGIRKCLKKGIPAKLLDVSFEKLPFSNDEFDVVISLETFEHLSNPQHAIDEVRRVLKAEGVFLCSIPNPLIGHTYLYPGLFTYQQFQVFLKQNGFEIRQVGGWQWAPRESIFPYALRRYRLVRSRYFSGVIRRIINFATKGVGVFPYFLYWLWTFETLNRKSRYSMGMIARQALETSPSRRKGQI
jgi:SAM-dependent methyltransferase